MVQYVAYTGVMSQLETFSVHALRSGEVEVENLLLNEIYLHVYLDGFLMRWRE